MLSKLSLGFLAVVLAAVPAPAETRSDAATGGSQAHADLTSRSDDAAILPGRRSFYAYPRHRHVNGGGDNGGSAGQPRFGSYDRSPNYDGNYGSAYYGINYGAPYHGGGYYDGGVYYRERRD